MKKYLYFALAVLYACSSALAQDDYPTETDLYVFWQPDRPLTPADFQKSDSLSDRQKRISDAHALYCVGCFGLWTQADAPKGKWTRKRTEVVYIAPAFEKKSSFILHGDTAGIVHEQLLFDLQEVGARLLRYKLEEIKKEADRAAGIQAIVLNTCKAKVREFVDAMSSFGGVDIPVSDWGIDFLVSSANKCIQGVPGFSFILCRRDKLLSSEGKARSLSLDLLDQWKGMEKDGKWRFTSPTHVVLAFSKALDELEAEGGIPARHRRYAENNRLLIEKMRAMGFAPYIDGSRQGPIITTFFYPAGVPFQFSEFYTYIKERGYVLYPGKLTDADTFRVGNIGEIYPEDIEKLASIIAGFLAAHKEEIA